MRQARAEEISFVIYKDLRLVFQSAESGTMDDAVAVTLKLGTRRTALSSIARPREFAELQA